MRKNRGKKEGRGGRRMRRAICEAGRCARWKRSRREIGASAK